MKRIKKMLAVALCCLVLCFDAGSSYVYAADVSPAYTKGRLAWDGVAWALLSALGIATGEATGAVDFLTDNVWSPLLAHLKEKWGSMCDVYVDKTNNKSYVSKDMMQDAFDWGNENDLWNIQGEESSDPPSLQPSLETQMHHFYDTEKFFNYLDGTKIYSNNGELTATFDAKDFLSRVDKTWFSYNFTVVRIINSSKPFAYIYNIQVPDGGSVKLYRGDYNYIYVKVYDKNNNAVEALGNLILYNLVTKYCNRAEGGCNIDNANDGLSLGTYDSTYIYANMGTAPEPSLQPSLEIRMHHFYDNKKFINYLDGKYPYTHDGITYSFDSKEYLRQDNVERWHFPFTIAQFYDKWHPELDFYNIQVPDGGYAILKRGRYNQIRVFVYDKDNNAIDALGHWYSYDFVTKSAGYAQSAIMVDSINGFCFNVSNLDNITANMGTGEGSPSKDYAIDSGLTVPKAGEKIDDWLAAQDKVNGGSVGLLGNDVSIPSDVTGTDTAIDALPLTIPSFGDLVINGQPAIDDILSQGLVKANSGDIADSQSAAGAVVGAEDEAATGENAEANAISVDQAQTALKNLMQQGIDYITLQIPNNFWNKIPFSIPYDIYLLIHGIFVGSHGGSKKAPRREASSGSNMPVGDPSNVGIEIDIPTVPLKYTEEKTEDTPPNFTFTLNIPYTTPEGQTANFNKEFTIETAKYNYFAKIIKFSIGLLWLSSVFQWLLAIFSKG